MGLGHVPAGPVPEERAGAHLPRRQRRRGRAPRSGAARRRRLGGLGETVAAAHLTRRGCVVLARNVRVGRSEIDLIVRDGRRLVAVEVKTRTTGDPRTRFDDDKVEALRRAMRRLDPSPTRLDLVTVELNRGIATVRWIRGAG